MNWKAISLWHPLPFNVPSFISFFWENQPVMEPLWYANETLSVHVCAKRNTESRLIRHKNGKAGLGIGKCHGVSSESFHSEKVHVRSGACIPLIPYLSWNQTVSSSHNIWREHTQLALVWKCSDMLIQKLVWLNLLYPNLCAQTFQTSTFRHILMSLLKVDNSLQRM